MAALGAVLGGNAPSVQAAPPAIGIGMGGNYDWQWELLFADAIKTARPWGNPGSPGDQAASVDANGWPTQDAGIFVVTSNVSDLSGTYALSFNGKAAVITGISCNLSVQNQLYTPGTNTTTASVVVPSGQTMIQIAFTGTQRTNSSATGTGITNVKLMRPISPGASTSFAPSVTFNTGIKNLVSRFSTVRYMDTVQTNWSTVSNWTDRKLPSYATQKLAAGPNGPNTLDRGVAWEYVIQFANETGKDAWINVPALATDDYITKLAQLFKYGSDANGNPYTSAQTSPVYAPLNPNLHLYVEYSNEVWNGGFASFHQNHDLAYAAVHNNTAEGQALNFGLGAVNDANQYTWMYRRVINRGKDISNFFRAVYGDGAMMSRVRPVYEWQEGGLTVPDELPFLDDYYNNGDGQNHVANPHPPSYYFWSGGGSAYYSPNTSSDTLTLDQIFASIPGGIGSAWLTDTTWAYAYGLKHSSYEGGPGLDTNGHSDAVKAQAVLDPRMETAVVNGQTIFDQTGGDLLMYFDATSDYQWGFASDVNNLNTYKLQAINDINAGNKAAVTAGTTIPAASIDPIPTTQFKWFDAGRRIDNLIKTPTGGTFTVTALISDAAPVRILVDNQLLGTVAVPAGGGYTVPLPFTVTSGLHAISFRNMGTTRPFFASYTINPAPPLAATINGSIAWDFNGNTGSETSVNPTTTSPFAATSAISRGSGLLADPPGLSGYQSVSGTYEFYPKANAFPATQAGSEAGGYCTQWTVKPNAGVTLAVKNLLVGLGYYAASNPSALNGNMEYSLDGVTFNPVPLTPGTSGPSYSIPVSTVDLSGISALQNLASGSTTTFRLNFWDPSQQGYIKGGIGPLSGNDLCMNVMAITSGLLNGSFETPSVGSASYTYNPTGGNWTFTGGSGIQSNGSAWGAPNAPDGVQTAFLQSSQLNTPSVISQPVAFGSAGNYTLSCQAALRSYSPGGPQSAAVFIDGTQVGTISPSATYFNSYSVGPFAVSAGTHTLSFQSTNNTNGDSSLFLDSVSLSAGAVSASAVKASSVKVASTAKPASSLHTITNPNLPPSTNPSAPSS